MKRLTFPENGKVMEAVARRFQTLGDPQRLRLLQLLESGEKTVGQLAALLGAHQPNVSRHLRALFDTGLVARRKHGNSVSYSVADPMVYKLCGLVCNNVVEQARADMAEIAGSQESGDRSQEPEARKRKTEGVRRKSAEGRARFSF